MTQINDYGLIGDGRSAALISRAGSIDWLCWPRFDSPPIFASLLDPHGGRWTLAPVEPARTVRRYIPDSNVLETTYDTASGRVVVTDAMTGFDESAKRHLLLPAHELLRRVACTRGEVELELVIDPRPDFKTPDTKRQDALGLRWQLGSRLLTLRADVPIAAADPTRFRLRAGETATFSLAFDEDGPAVLPPLGEHAADRIERTIAWWQAWAARATYHGPYREQVVRGALAIKLMGFAPSGAIIAAPTTSLPERIGADMNWDYRFCWLRDASFTARALLNLGYVEEAEAFCSWLLHTTRLTAPELRVMYDVYGNAPMQERELHHLQGFAGSRPVRIGNATYDQLQLDMYGEVIDAIAHVVNVVGELDRDTRRLLREFGDYVARHWHLPDAGIWEPRDKPQHRTHSRVLCWVALDRLIALCKRGYVDRVDPDLLAHHRERIRRDIEQHAWDASAQAYTSAFGSSELDASVLLMSWYGFHPAGAARMRSTYARLCERLGAGPGLLYRYEDSLRSGEGAFWICSYWAVEHLALGGGTLARAHELFAAAGRYANDLGLMAEEVDPATGQPIGNFPQAYTHVGLISAALTLEERARRQLPQPRAPQVEARP